MTNFEKYKKEIVEADYLFGLDRSDNIHKCDCMDCEDCQFGLCGCGKQKIKWLHKEAKPTLTKQERAFCEMFHISSSKYIARDEDGDIYIYQKKPYKDRIAWCTGENGNASMLNNNAFPFITWEDNEPWNIRDLLQLKVED